MSVITIIDSAPVTLNDGIASEDDWLEKKRLDDLGDLRIGELIGIESVGYGCDRHVGVRLQLLADARSGFPACEVAVHHEDEAGRGVQELSLYGGEMCAEECDRGDADLVQAHDAPWTLDDEEAVGVADPVEVVEQSVFGQPWREVPLSTVSDDLWIEPSSGIAEGPRLEIVESDADCLVEEALASVEPGLEAPRGIGMNRLTPEEIGLMVQRQPAAKRDEGLGGSSDGLDGRLLGVRLADYRAEVLGDLAVGATVESADELDDIAASVTCRETSPEVLGARDDESTWIVAPVDRACAVEVVCLAAHGVKQASMGEDLLDGDASFETTEAQVGRDHVAPAWSFPFPFPRSL